MPDTKSLNLDPEIVRRMLGEASQRPHPKEILASLCQSSLPQQLVEDSRNTARNRSRSRERRQPERCQHLQASSTQSGIGGLDDILSVETARCDALDNRDSMLPHSQQEHLWQVPTITQMPEDSQVVPPWRAQSCPVSQASCASQEPIGTSLAALPPSGLQLCARPVRSPDLQSLHAAQTHWPQIQNHPPVPVPPIPVSPGSTPTQAFFPLQGDPTSLLTHALWMVAGLSAPSSANGSSTAAFTQPQVTEHRQPQPINACPGMASWLSMPWR